jgi:hypothetical protein
VCCQLLLHILLLLPGLPKCVGEELLVHLQHHHQQ